MFRVTIEVLPGAAEASRRTVGSMTIGNISDFADISDCSISVTESDNPLAETRPERSTLPCAITRGAESLQKWMASSPPPITSEQSSWPDPWTFKTRGERRAEDARRQGHSSSSMFVLSNPEIGADSFCKQGFVPHECKRFCRYFPPTAVIRFSRVAEAEYWPCTGGLRSGEGCESPAARIGPSSRRTTRGDGYRINSPKRNGMRSEMTTRGPRPSSGSQLLLRL
ncbi:hypothetical protein ACVMIH_002337 [Bradyrhizobium sp. USDA 4503]